MTRQERETAVDWFCMRMKLKLREPRNEAKGGWHRDTFHDLLIRLKQEQREFEAELFNPRTDYHAIINEAIDVAAFAMFAADNARRAVHGDLDCAQDNCSAGKSDEV